MVAIGSNAKESMVLCKNSQGLEIQATLLRLTRQLAAFEIYEPNNGLRTSEVLNEFNIVLHDSTLYSGRAVVSNLINVGTVIVGEAKLDESGFALNALHAVNGSSNLRQAFDAFLGDWQKLYRVLPEFKVVVADMQTFLADLRLWLDRVELEIRSAPSGDRVEMERRAAQEIGASVVPAFDAMHERLESLSGSIEEELRPVHQNFSKRQLHPLMLCSPFGYRTYHKPLGYAGDYEMVNMIARDPYEGPSLFAKVVNLWFLSQWPAKAHRQRIAYLRRHLAQECMRGERLGRPLRIFNVGCGPALEIQEFLAEDPLCDYAQFSLLDFNEETLQYTSRALDGLKKRFGRRTSLQLQRKSIQHVLKEGAKPLTSGTDGKYDFIYCAGLFDYLPDRTCRQLMNIFYDWLAPSGLLVVTNVDDCKPFRHMLEFVLDWHLIYRDTRKATALFPERLPPGLGNTCREETGVNIFLEARKPENNA